MDNNAIASTVYRFGNFEVDTSERTLRRGPDRVAITPRAFDLLLCLVQNRGKLLAKETLLNEVWADAVVEEGNLNRTISSLRKALGETRGANQYIETIPKAGYRFVADVSVTKSSPETSKSPTSPSAEPGRREPTARRFRWLFGLAAFVLLFGTLLGGYLIFSRAQVPAASAPKDDVLRVTNNDLWEDGAVWTRDGYIRFVRFQPGNRPESVVVGPDGTGEKAAGTEIKDLRAGNWSPDGSNVAFVKKNEGGATVYIAKSDGSGVYKLPFMPGSLDWSPDSTKFVYNALKSPDEPSNAEIFIYDITSRKSENLTRDPSFDANASFSPDGKRVLFNSDRDGNSELYVMNVDGSGVKRLTNHPAKEAFHSFSPDGTQIIFNSNRENEKIAMFIIDAEGERPPVRVSDPAYNSEIRPGCWSPDGTRVVFTSDRGGDKYNIYTMNAEAFPASVFYEDPAAEARSARISPDGIKLAVSVEKEDQSGELHVVKLPRGSTLVAGRSDEGDLSPVWSPDGSKLAFACKAGGNTEICIAAASGGQVVNLTNNGARDVSPAWSPDGSGIVFASDRDGKFDVMNLFRMNADGSGQQKLMQRQGYELSPAWDGTGRGVLFSGDRVDGVSRSLDIYIYDPISGTERQLVSRRLHDTEPAVSPDGSMIAFVSESDGNPEIYLAKADGSAPLRLTRNLRQDVDPSFTPDGRSVIFASDRSGKFAIYKIDLTS